MKEQSNKPNENQPPTKPDTTVVIYRDGKPYKVATRDASIDYGNTQQNKSFWTLLARVIRIIKLK